MADDRVSILFEAREQLSKAVKKMDKALGDVEESLDDASGSMAAASGPAEALQSQLRGVEDEAGDASINLGSLMGKISDLDRQAAMTQVNIPIDVEDVEEMEVEEAAQKVKNQIERHDIDLELDQDQLMRELEEAEVKATNKLNRFERGRATTVDVDFDADVVELGEEVDTAQESVEKSAETVDVGLNIPEKQKEGLFGSLYWATKAVEEDPSSTIDMELNIPEQESGELILELHELTNFIDKVPASTIDIDIDLDATDEALELAVLVSQMDQYQAQAMLVAGSSRAAANGVDKLGDEASESAAEMGVLASVMNITSLNMTVLAVDVGAFNIALANLATQIPILIGLIGTFGTAIAGIAGAFMLAAAGIGAFLGAGLLSQLTEMEESMEGIESKAEAMQVIMQSLVSEFEKAIEPLTELTEGSNIFFDAINTLLETINAVSKAIAESFRFSRQEMEEFIAVGESMGIIDEEMSRSEASEEIMSLGEFMDEVGDIFAENAGDILRSFKIMSAFLLPVLADIIDFFVSGFDDMIIFVTKLTKELSAIGPAFARLIDFAVQIIDIAATVIQGVLPVLVGLITIVTEIASAFNSLDSQIIRNISGFLILAKVSKSLFNVYTGLAGVIATVTKGTFLHSAAQGVDMAATEGNISSKYGLGAALIFLRSVYNSTRVAILGKIRALKSSVAATKTATFASLVQSFAQIALSEGLIAATRATWSYVTSQFSAAASTWSTNAALVVFNALTGGVLILLGALVAAGGAVVAMMSQTESVTSGLGTAMKKLKQAIMPLANVLLGSFISAANSLIRAFKGIMAIVNPIVNALNKLGVALGLTSEGGDGASGSMSILAASFKAVLLPTEILLSILGEVAFMLGQIIGASIQFTIDFVMALVDAFIALATWLSNVIPGGEALAGMFGGMFDAVMGLIDAIVNLPSTLRGMSNAFMGIVEGMMNFVIRKINGMIQWYNSKVPNRLEIGEFNEVDLQAETGAVNRGDLTQEDADDAEDSVAGKQPNEFNYNEENISNIDQEVNADPEDKESIRRVVKDAMEEAEAFGRRNQGHTG